MQIMVVMIQICFYEQNFFGIDTILKVKKFYLYSKYKIGFYAKLANLATHHYTGCFFRFNLVKSK